MIFSRRRIVIALLSAASCFQFAACTVSYCEDIARRLSKIRTITMIDGCENTEYGIWLYAGGGHISLIGEPIIMDKNNKEDAAPSSNWDDEDPKNSMSTISSDNTPSCPTLVFDDGGEKLDKVMIDASIAFFPPQQDDSSSNGEQQDPTNEGHATPLWKEDAMRLHKTSYENNNEITSSYLLSGVTAAYHHAMRRMGDYNIFNNNCATFVLNMMVALEIKVDSRIIKFAASELYKNHTIIEPVLQNQTFMEDLFLEFDHDASSSHKTTTTGLIRNRNHHQAQASDARMVADSLEGTEMFVTHYVKEWNVKYHETRKMMETPP